MTDKKTVRPEMGKWALWRFFAKDAFIRPYLPPTAALSEATLTEFFKKYHAVYIKPSGGWGGKGITKAWRTKNGFVFVKERGKPVECSTIHQLFVRTTAERKGKLHIVQKAIDLAEWKGRPFDIRLMMMRNANGKWQYAGMLAKVAGKSSVITNVARGRGFVLDIDTALTHALKLTPTQLQTLKQKMIDLGYKTCKRFDDYNRYRNIGLDLAVDKHGRVWVIEENTAPALYLFKKLKDQTLYRNLMRIVAERRRAHR